jgi:glycosyltransferase involved in cell wall biosynthesis
MHLCVIIPALNEAATLGTVIGRIRRVSMPTQVRRTTIIVVDDGSTDGTAEIAIQAGATLVRHETNYGVGRAFRSGVDAALARGADLIVNIDADGQFDPDDIPRLLAPILAGRADFVTASRFKDPALLPDMPAVKLWGNRRMSQMISLIVGQKFYDVSCGFRAYSRDAALRLNLWGDFTYTQESFLDLSAKGVRIAEVPAKVRGVREIGESRVAASIWHYARRSFGIIARAYRDYWPMQFFGLLGGLVSIPGLGFLTFLGVHRLRSGMFTPHIWSGFVGGALLAFAATCLLTGILGSILRRIRLNQEEMLYLMKMRVIASGRSLDDVAGEGEC